MKDLFTPTEAEIAYTAGILDGEGCIRMQKNYGLDVSVANTDYFLLDWLKAHWGGRISNTTRKPLQWYPRSKPVGVWTISGKKAIAMLDACEPYILLKKDRVKLAQKLEPLIHKKDKYRPQFNEEMRRQRHEIYLELKQLNRRGVAA